MGTRELARGEFNRYWKFLTVGTGSIALISLIQRLWGMELHDILSWVVRFYRGLTGAVFDVIEAVVPFHLELPRTYLDLLTLSLLLGMPALRIMLEVMAKESDPAEVRLYKAAGIVYFLLLAGLGAPLFVLMFRLLAVYGDRMAKSGTLRQDVSRRLAFEATIFASLGNLYAVSIASMLTVAIVFFALNATL